MASWPYLLLRLSCFVFNFDAYGPQVTLDDAVFIGFRESATDEFLVLKDHRTNGRRLRLPEPVSLYEGLHYVQDYSNACPQQFLRLPNGLDSEPVFQVNKVVARIYDASKPTHEDCLTRTINVVKPSYATPKSLLPVIVVGVTIVVDLWWWLRNWFHQHIWLQRYNGSFDVSRSIDVGQPVIFVSMNYRIFFQAFPRIYFVPTALGSMPGKEVKEAKVGNLVETPGPEVGADLYLRVWWQLLESDHGESACAIPVSLHTLVNKGNQGELFRGAVMQSGGPIPVGDIENGKPASQYSVLRGHVSNVPMITAQMEEYLKLFMMPDVKDSEVDLVLKHYPNDQRAGCPFDAGIKHVPSTVPLIHAVKIGCAHGKAHNSSVRPLFRVISYSTARDVDKYGKNLLFIGVAHALDTIAVFGLGGDLKDCVIRFVNYLDPNGKSGPGVLWPHWNPHEPKVIVFQDGALFPIVLGNDNYRTDALNHIAGLTPIRMRHIRTSEI
ncbi:hypothetical protein H4582DRAFT_2194964 [Lactarius indigo]|nr:hypothetical protein H4582DRAFT_2194964 [Lactarius indigo]